MNSDEVLIVSTKAELLKFGYVFTNVNKEVIYEGRTFLLKQCGIRNTLRIPFMGYPNPNPAIITQKPIWNMKLGEITLSINDII